MRYAAYHKKILRLDRQIARQTNWQARLEARPWYLHFFETYRARAIAKAIATRQELARQRANLDTEMFGSPALIWNTNPAAMFRRTVPTSAQAVATLVAAADAALEVSG